MPCSPCSNRCEGQRLFVRNGKCYVDWRYEDVRFDDVVCQRSEHEHVQDAWPYAPFWMGTYRKISKNHAIIHTNVPISQKYSPVRQKRPSSPIQRRVITFQLRASIAWFSMGRVGHHRRQSAVFTQQRSISATLQAWATHPRGVKGGSASKISLMVPTQASPRCGTKPSRHCRALVRSAG